MTSHDWEALVEEGRRLAQEAPLDRWAFGDLALLAVPPSGGSRAERTATQQEVARFADAIGVTYGFLKDCWYTSKDWPVGMRFADISHAKHSRYRNRKNRVALLLDDDIAGEISSKRVRDQVEKAEALLRDKKVRDAIIARSETRKTRIAKAARAIENEELLEERTRARIQEQDLRAQAMAPEYRAKAPDRFLKANQNLARTIMELLDLQLVIHEVSRPFHDRTAGNLEQIRDLSQRLLDTLRPGDRSPQPHNVVDIDLDDQVGGAHRSQAGLPRAQGS